MSSRCVFEGGAGVAIGSVYSEIVGESLIDASSDRVEVVLSVLQCTV